MGTQSGRSRWGFTQQVLEMTDRIFLVPDSNTRIVIRSVALQHIYAYAQTRWHHSEAGGQIFSSTPHLSEIVVTQATGPHPPDKRSRHHFNPDPVAATNDRVTLFNQDLHAVGLWHTHPERNPSPSGPDHEATLKYLASFQGEMNGFLLLILGNSGTPLNLAVWLASERPIRTWVKLLEVSEQIGQL